MLYDTRAQGESEGDLYALGWEDDLDILAAVDYLQQREDVDAERIGVLGLSAGSKAALHAAARTGRISAVVAEGCRFSTFEDWLIGVEPADTIWVPAVWLQFKYPEVVSGIRNPAPLRETVRQISPRPIFWIAAGGEKAYSQAYFEAAGEPKTIWLRDEPGHQIDALFDEPEEYEKRILGFFDQALLDSD